MKHTTRSIARRTTRRKEKQVEKWQRIPQARRELVAHLAPMYQTASRARKQLVLDEVVKTTGYARTSAIRLLNHPPEDAQIIRRPRLPRYGPEVQQALFLAWKATHCICAKRLMPSLPALVEGLERHHHLCLTEEERRQVQTMSVTTAERFLRTQPKPCLSGFSLTTPGVLRKSQIPVRTFAQWEDARPGFVEMDLVAHCGTHADDSFLSTLTDIATRWTECVPLLSKSADAVVAALEQARVLFPFPLLGIDTDDGCEFINERLLSYCVREHLTFTRGRPGVKNDQNHVEQKKRAVVREAVGYVRLEGIQTYHQLRDVYRALRLMVTCFQPTVKLQARAFKGDRVRRISIKRKRRHPFLSLDTRPTMAYTLRKGRKNMRTQSPDTSLAAERYLIERIRQAPASKHFHLVQSLSQRMLTGHTPKQDIRAEAIHAITCGYGRRIGERVAHALAQHLLWQEQPVDLSATVWPVMHALKAAGISSYIGGSIASSLHGMQQSARDIDLVLIGQGGRSLPLGTILATLMSAYLVEPEEIQQALSEGNTVSILHVGTLMKLDLILPETPDFDDAMQASIVSLPLDKRYGPFPVASALEMAVWKLVRCARELATRPDGIVNDAEWNDVLGILKVQGTRLDLAQLTFWAHRLGAGHLLALALDDAGLSSPQAPSPRRLAG